MADTSHAIDDTRAEDDFAVWSVAQGIRDRILEHLGQQRSVSLHETRAREAIRG